MTVKATGRLAWGRAVSWRGHGWTQYLPAIVIGTILVVLVIPPILVLIEMAFTNIGPGGDIEGLTLEHFAEILRGSRLYSSAWNTLVFAALSAVLSLLLGGGMAWIAERTDAQFRVLTYVTTVVALATPYILYVTAWLFLLGRVGPINQFYREVLGGDGSLINVNSMAGMIFIEGLLWSPLAFLLMGATFKRANAEMEEAARMSGAGIWQTLWRISSRLALPAILGLALFIFIRGFEAFEVPALVGMPRRIFVLTTDIYLGMSSSPPRIGYSSAFATVLIAVVSILLFFYSRLSKRADAFASITGKSFRPRRYELGRWRWLGSSAIVAYFLLLVVAPLLTLAWISFVPFLQGFSLNRLMNPYLGHYQAVFRESIYGEFALNTIIASSAAATVVVILTSLAGWLAIRRWPGGPFLEQIAGLSLVFPGVVLGVAVVEVALFMPFDLYGTLTLVAIAFVIRYLPYGMRYSTSGIFQIHRELEEAAGIAGASQMSILLRIVFPLLLPTLAAAWLFVFLVASKELSMALLLAGARSKTIAVAMYDQWANGEGGEVAAMGILWTIVITACTGLLFLLFRRQGRNLGGALG